MFRSGVCDAGGMLVVAGALEGDAPVDTEWLALDWCSVTVGRFMVARHEGNVRRASVEVGLALSVIDEWFPVRPIVTEALVRAGHEAVDALDSWSAVILAERLGLSLFTASDEVSSSIITVERPW